MATYFVVVRLMVKPNILVVCRSFLPQAGGIEEYAYNRCLQDPEQVVVATMACEGDQQFDRLQPFPIYRWLPPRWVQSPRGLGSVRLTNFCRQSSYFTAIAMTTSSGVMVTNFRYFYS
jgi:hypothetical protein